ncbi:MAG: asparagine synthase (glutamine-hydrolyzing) [Aureispira sp.]|nr:asparagine synthase (glutamine-hydrolyzing) [Aureispira sp.]
MCRIAGFWDFNTDLNYDKKAVLVNMRDSLQHGGPDSAGEFIDGDQNLGLGHRRLSILDLSEAGTQPMYWNDLVIIFNGETYNFAEPRKRLKEMGYTFQTGTDTEVLLKGFEAWGMDMIHQFRGMFSFAIWNKTTHKLTLCRDRVGVKPLYWYWKDGLFMFGSELKAFHEHPKFDKTIDQEALSLYLQQGYIHYPHCIFKHAHKLEPGAFLEIDLNQQIKTSKYWDAQEVYSNSKITTKKEPELLEELEDLLTESFELRMVSDVPVGAFLSGGIDSSLVTALLQKKEGRQLKTFTIGFDQAEYNEAGHAKLIAEHLGTEHYEFYCTSKEAAELIPKLPEMYDEPFGDGSGLPTYLVAKMAREHVTVSLSADGGDEIFGGYTKYEIAKNFYPKIKKMPGFMRGMFSGMAGMIDPLWLERNSSKFPVLRNYKNISNKFPKLRNALKAKDAIEFFHISSTYITPKELQKLYPVYQQRYQTAMELDPQRLLSLLGTIDIQTYLEGDIMPKVDRATMQVALEGRDPFLDHKIIEFAMTLPDHLKMKGNSTKYLLRQLLFKHVPRELIERPKQGFSVPVQEWLLTILKDDLEEMKQDQDFLTCFEFDAATLQQWVDSFKEQRKYVNPHFIWFLYMLYKWYQRWIENK